MAYTFSNDSSVESCDTFSAKFPPNFVLFPNSIRVGSNRIHSFSNAREQYRLICQLVKGNNACSCIMHHIAYSEMGIVRGKTVAASSFAKFSHRFRKFELLVRSLIREFYTLERSSDLFERRSVVRNFATTIESRDPRRRVPSSFCAIRGNSWHVNPRIA